MNIIINLLLNYLKSKATTELVKAVAFSLLRALASRSDAKTDDSAVKLLESIESGSIEAVEQSVADLVNSIGIDLANVAKKQIK